MRAMQRMVGATLATIVAMMAAIVSTGSSIAADGVDTTPPSAPTITRIYVDFGYYPNVVYDGATDDVGVVGYRLFVNGRFLYETTIKDPSHRFPEPWETTGTWWFQVQAVDAAGNVSRKSAPVPFDYDLPAAPPFPSGFQATASGKPGCITMSTARLTHDREFSVRVLVDGRIHSSTTPSLVHDGGPLEICNLEGGDRYVQLQSWQSEASRRSRKTPPIKVTLETSNPPTISLVSVGPVRPRPPRPEALDLEFTRQPGSYDIIVLDGLREVWRVGNPDRGALRFPLPDSPTGDDRHWFQLQTIYPDGTRSARSAPLFYRHRPEPPPPAPVDLSLYLRSFLPGSTALVHRFRLPEPDVIRECWFLINGEWSGYTTHNPVAGQPGYFEMLGRPSPGGAPASYQVQCADHDQNWTRRSAPAWFPTGT